MGTSRSVEQTPKFFGSQGLDPQRCSHEVTQAHRKNQVDPKSALGFKIRFIRDLKCKVTEAQRSVAAAAHHEEPGIRLALSATELIKEPIQQHYENVLLPRQAEADNNDHKGSIFSPEFSR